ncbi:hypothetical protein [Chrysiogenes arsenatis]|uniref:hypothetical protein n=1 Tax=Chrysiogenes arsenatis TaxID=309797 RepID=UPI000409B753|nr:hypothetical protein [Chrysiogenes arsenatis]
MRMVLMMGLVVAFAATGCGRQEVYAPSNSQITVLGSSVLLEDASGSRDEHFFVIKERASNTTTIEVGRQGRVPQFNRPPAAPDPCQTLQSSPQHPCIAPPSYPYGYQQPAYAPYGMMPPTYPTYPGYYPMPAAPMHYPVPVAMPPVFYVQP